MPRARTDSPEQFDFRSLFVPRRIARPALEQLVRRELAGKTRTSSISWELLGPRKPGDRVSLTNLGAATRVRQGMPKSLRVVGEHLAYRLYDTVYLVGARSATSPMLSEPDLERIRALCSALDAIAYDGWSFVAPEGHVIANLRSRSSDGDVKPYYVCVWTAASRLKLARSRGLRVEGPFRAPKDVPELAHSLESGLAFLTATRGAKVRALQQQLRAQIDAAGRFWVVRGRDAAGAARPARQGEVTYDGLRFVAVGPKGELVLDRA